MSVQVVFYSFYLFLHRIPATQDDLDMLIGVHFNAFHRPTDDTVVEFAQQNVAQILREQDGAISIAHILA